MRLIIPRPCIAFIKVRTKQFEAVMHTHGTLFQRQLQTISITIFLASLFLSVIIGCSLFVLLFVNFPPLATLYLVWMYMDRKTPEMGSRPIRWVKNVKLFQHAKDYFPSNLSLDDDFHLDPRRNYLFCYFPHGIVPSGSYNNLVGNASDFHKLYPKYNVLACTLNGLFYTPLWREYAMAVGLASCSRNSLNYLLSRPEGGNISVLAVGGISETLCSQPGRYRCVVKNRTGFVKAALETGAPLVPVISFGEPDILDQLKGPKVDRVYSFFWKVVGAAPVIYYGRAWLVPKRKTVTTVVGKALEVPKVKNPRDEMVKKVHRKFVEELEELFEKHKWKYLENPGSTSLELL